MAAFFCYCIDSTALKSMLDIYSSTSSFTYAIDQWHRGVHSATSGSAGGRADPTGDGPPGHMQERRGLELRPPGLSPASRAAASHPVDPAVPPIDSVTLRKTTQQDV